MDQDTQLHRRVREDDGLVAGLPAEAAEVVRSWCTDQIDRALLTAGREAAERQVERVIPIARGLTAVVGELGRGRDGRWLVARLSRLVPDGAKALAVLRSEAPLTQRLTLVLAQITPPCTAHAPSDCCGEPFDGTGIC